MSNRNYRIADEIKKDLTDIFRNESKDPRIDAMLSVTSVEVTNDLSLAKVYVSKLGSDKERQEVLEALNKAKGFFRSELSKRLRTRSVPELRFYLDDSLAYGEKIETILRQIGDLN